MVLISTIALSQTMIPVVMKWLFKCNCTRRSQGSKQIIMNVGSTDTDIVNWCRWVAMPMHLLHYTQIDFILKPFLPFTWFM
jgi:hypothetical protein